MQFALKWSVALIVSGIVGWAACNGKCNAIASATLEGLAAGIGHGVIVAACKWGSGENSYPIKRGRLIGMVKRDARVGLVSGLLIGIVRVL